MGMAFQDLFDPHMFLAYIGAGRTIAVYRQHSPIFAQGDVADAVFYIQRGQVKLTVVSPQGKEAVIAILDPPGLLWGGLPDRSAAAHRDGHGAHQLCADAD